MVQRIEDMPAGTIGLLASGKLTRKDYTDVLEPALSEGVQSGELRLLFVLADFDGLEAGAIPEDIKTGAKAWVRDHAAWRRMALATDVHWVAKAMHAFAWLAPGEVRVFELGDQDEARDWVAG